MKGVTLWVVGEYYGEPHSWAIRGILDDRDKAIEACCHPTDFVAPMILNEVLSDEQEDDWPGIFYPFTESQGATEPCES